MNKVNIIGKGKWYEKVHPYLIRNFEIVSYENANWVFVLTDVSSHYELVYNALEANKNVFCEKPLTLSYESSVKLYTLADEKNILLYVDDVFSWHNIDLFGIRHFYWNKINSQGFLERLAYHHFYLIYYYYEQHNLRLNSILNVGPYSFKLVFEDNNIFTFDYSPQEKPKNVLSNLIPNKNAFENMILQVVSGEEKLFKKNKNATLFSVNLIEKLRYLVYRKIAVIGAGIFGLTAAVKLSSAGYNVEVFEKNDEILKGASGSNEYRVHRGFHYPRSKDTALECKQATPRFEKIFQKALIGNENISHLYSISKELSKVSKNQYEKFLKKIGLNFVEKKSDSSKISGQYIVEENLYDPEMMKEILQSKVYATGVKIHFNSEITSLDNLNHDYKVIATYSMNNTLIKDSEDYQFEIVEKPLVKLPKILSNTSNVIMDGPFFCFDPLLNTEYHLLGNVTHAIHKTNVGKFPDTSGFEHLINKGLIKNPQPSKIREFINDFRLFYPNISTIQHIGSYFTVRVVLKNRDYDDARPTYLRKHNKNIFSIFSGKIVTALNVADELTSKINDLENIYDRSV